MNTISGTVHLRPARLGFVASELTADAVCEAARLASGVWGGIYFPILSANDSNLTRRAEALAVDVLHPLDHSPATRMMTDAPGFQWRGISQWGPFGSDDPDYREGLLPIERLVEPTAAGSWNISWSEDDRAALYGVWFGQSAAAAEQPLTSPSLDDLWSTGNPFTNSPIANTASLIEYNGEDTGLCVLVVGHDPADLVRLWNLRALGGQVHPWLVGRDQESLLAVDAWLRDDDVLAHAHRPRRGDGTELGPLVRVSAGQPESGAVASICDAIENLGFTVRTAPAGFHGGWTGRHPLVTPAERDFNLPVAPDTTHVDITLPTLPILGTRRALSPGTVAADVVVHHESETSSGRTLTLPAIRCLAPVIDKLTADFERFHRPSGEGRVVAVQGNAASVSVSLVPGIRVFESVLPGNAVVGQSDDGRFATHFVTRLGGVNSVAASQPAVRQVLYDLSNSDRSAPIARLLQAALNQRGRWPGSLSRQSPNDYAKSVVYGLAGTGLVVPSLSLRCPRCSTETDVRPGDLDVDMRCVVCRSEFNLSLALALQGQANPWRYRLAAHLPPGRIRSGLAAMAANAVLRTAHRAGAAPAMPHLFGLTIKLDGWECEIDIAALILDGPLTLAVVGELKGGRELLSDDDIENLKRVQQLLRAAEVETLFLAGTTRDRLEPSEVAILRAACEAAPPRLGGSDHALALPIVLCGPDMSTPWIDDAHPWRWGRPGGAPLGGLAEVSCQRNLGLPEGAPSWLHGEGRWSFRWTDDAMGD